MLGDLVWKGVQFVLGVINDGFVEIDYYCIVFIESLGKLSDLIVDFLRGFFL